MVPIEVPIHKYFSEPQNYNPDNDRQPQELIRLDPDLELDHPFNIAAGWRAEGF